MDSVATILRAAEGLRFRGLFANDDLTCQPRARRAIMSAMAKLQGDAASRAFAYATGVDALSCRGYSYMYNYQFAFARERYPTQFAAPSSNMFDWPQAYCLYKDDMSSNSSWCIPNPSGGAFKGNATIVLKTANGQPVRYTTDGTEPTPDSPVAYGPLAISASTVVTVQTANVAFAPQPPTRMEFIRVA
jgi:hypothetical protein